MGSVCRSSNYHQQQFHEAEPQSERLCKVTYRLLEGGHDIVGEVDVLEHALQLCRELAATLSLEFRDHGFLSVVAGTPPKDEPLRQILLVESLENIFTLQFEYCYNYL